MAEYHVEYRFDQREENVSGSVVFVHESADSLHIITQRVEERLARPVFAVDSENYGRVVINSANVRFVSIRIPDPPPALEL